MGGVQLAAYIVQQLSQGYTPDQVRNALQGYGYRPVDIDAAFASLNQAPTQDNGLQSYVSRQLAQGYPADQIRAYLLNYGYPPAAVEQAMAVSAQSERPNPAKPLLLIFFGIVLLVAIGAGLYYFAFAGGTAYSIDLIGQTEYSPGDSLIINNMLKNSAVDSVSVSYTIEDGSGKVITSWKDTLYPDGDGAATTASNLPEDLKPGSYRIIAKLTDAQDSADFSIKAKPLCSNGIQDAGEEGMDCGGACAPCGSCSDMVKNQGEDGIDCGGPCTACAKEPTCFDRVKNQDEEGIDCGGTCPACKDPCIDGKKSPGEEDIDCGGSCKKCETCEDSIRNQDEEGIDCGGVCTPCTSTSYAEYLQQAKNTAKEDAEGSIALCKKIDETFWSDTCYKEVAKISNQSSYCALASPAPRDSCYLHFVAQGNFDVCENIVDTYIRMNCESLKAIRTT